MLQGQLTARRVLLALLAGIVLLSCGGTSDGGSALPQDRSLEQNVIRPGITAVENARTLACGSDLAALESALEIYELQHGVPAHEQSTLITAGLLRSATDLYDVRDGEISPRSGSPCPAPPSSAADRPTVP